MNIKFIYFQLKSNDKKWDYTSVNFNNVDYFCYIEI